MNESRLSNEQINRLTTKANGIGWELNSILDEFSASCITNIASGCLTNPLQVLIPAMPTISHHLGPSTIEITPNYTEMPIIYAAVIGNPSTGKTPAMKAVVEPCYEVERAFGINDKESKLANGATTECIIQMLSEHQRVLSHYDEGSAFFGSFGRYNKGGEALDRGVYLELYNGPKVFNRDTKNSRSRVYNGQLNLAILVHGYSFAHLIREEQVTLNDGLSHRFLIGAPLPNQNSNQSLASSGSASVSKVSFASLLYLVTRICETPVHFKLSKDGFERFDELHLFFRRVTFKANEVEQHFFASMFGKANTQLILLAVVIHVICVSFNYLRHIIDASSPKITNDFKTAVESSLIKSELIQLFLNIPMISVQRAYKFLIGFYKTKLVFANFEGFNEREVMFEQEILRYLTRNEGISRGIEINQLDAKLWKKIFMINQNLLTTVDLNRRFRISRIGAIDTFKKLEANHFGVYLLPNDNRNRWNLPAFKKIELELIHNNYKFSNSLIRIGLSLKQFIDNYGDPIHIDQYGNTIWPVNLKAPTPMPTQFTRSFMPPSDQDSTDGLQSSFTSSISLAVDERFNYDVTNETPEKRPLKTKSTSFMVDQSKDKTFKTNEEIIFDGFGSVSSIVTDYQVDPLQDIIYDSDMEHSNLAQIIKIKDPLPIPIQLVSTPKSVLQPDEQSLDYDPISRFFNSNSVTDYRVDPVQDIIYDSDMENSNLAQRIKLKDPILPIRMQLVPSSQSILLPDEQSLDNDPISRFFTSTSLQSTDILKLTSSHVTQMPLFTTQFRMEEPANLETEAVVSKQKRGPYKKKDKTLTAVVAPTVLAPKKRGRPFKNAPPLTNENVPINEISPILHTKNKNKSKSVTPKCKTVESKEVAKSKRSKSVPSRCNQDKATHGSNSKFSSDDI